MKKYVINIAEKEAHKSGQNFKHGAVLVQNGKVVSAGHNRVTTGKGAHIFSTHAEMAAIKQCSDRSSMSDAHMYVVRVNKGGNLADSRPCARCQKFMKMHKIQRCFFSTGKENTPFDSLYVM